MRAVLLILLAAGTSTAGAQTPAPGSTTSAVGPVRTITPVSAGALGLAPTRPADLVFPIGPIVESVSNQEPAIPPLGSGQLVGVKVLSPFRPGDNQIGILSVGNLNPLLASAQNFWSGHVAVHGTCEPPPLTPPGAKPDSKRGTQTVEPVQTRP
jgi:hypothetical protein